MSEDKLTDKQYFEHFLSHALTFDDEEASGIYKSFEAVDDDANHWMRHQFLSVAALTLAILGALRGDEVGGFKIASEYVATIAIGYATVAYACWSNANMKRRVFVLYFDMLSKGQTGSDTIDCLLKYPKAYPSTRYTVPNLLPLGRTTDWGQAISGALFAIVVICLAIAALVGWFAALAFVWDNSAGEVSEWVTKCVVLVHGLTVVLVSLVHRNADKRHRYKQLE